MELGASDHLLLALPLKSSLNSGKSCSKVVPGRIRVITQKKIEDLKFLLQSCTWPFDISKSADANYNVFLSVFLSCYNEVFPLSNCKSHSTNKPNSWITNGLKISANTKKLLHKESKTNKSDKFQTYFKNYRKIFKSTVALAKRLANDSFITQSKNKSKATWDVVKKELGLKTIKLEFPIEVDISLNKLQLNKKMVEIANEFNNYFVNTHKTSNDKANINLAVGAVSSKLSPNKLNSFKFKSVTENDILKIVNSINTTKAQGWDEISMFVVKQVIVFIMRPLCRIVNQSLETGVFPERLKYSLIKPIFKKGNINDPSCYRPIALLPAFSKVFEKIVNTQLLKYLEENKILSTSQFGFRENMSTHTAIRRVVDHVAGALDGSQRAAGVLCDLSGAFDSVNHSILLGKLEKLNVNDNELHWFKFYLQNRKQKIVLDKHSNKFYSNWQTVKYGVPQGSILGPTLFLIYVNDLHRSTSMEIIQYADDTTIVCSQKEIDLLWKSAKNGLLSLSDWFSVNGLSLNVSKTQVIEFVTDNRKKDTEVDFGQFVLSTKQSVTFLGLTIDANLNWKEHVGSLIKNLNNALFSLRILSNVSNLQTLTTVYYAYFESLISYGLIFWGSSVKADKVFKLQKKAVRSIARVPQRSSCKTLFQNFKILTLYSLFIYQISVMVKQHWNTFIESQPSHHYDTRNRNLIKPAKHRLIIFEKSPQYLGPKIFNKLPAKFHQIEELKKFKKSLKCWLLERPYYSLQEFLTDSFS